MKILLVAATELETVGLREELKMKLIHPRIFQQEVNGNDIRLIHTGIGMVNTAFFLGEYLHENKPDLAVNFGIAGSFDLNFQLGDVVEVVEDAFSELGAESPEGFLGLEQMGFPLFELEGKKVFNHLANPVPSAISLPKTKAITVNKVHGLADSIAVAKTKWNPEIETMEGAAFFHAMLVKNIPFFAFRGISNYVEVRNKANWKIGLAVKNVQNFIFRNTLEGWN